MAAKPLLLVSQTSGIAPGLRLHLCSEMNMPAASHAAGVHEHPWLRSTPDDARLAAPYCAVLSVNALAAAAGTAMHSGARLHAGKSPGPLGSLQLPASQVTCCCLLSALAHVHACSCRLKGSMLHWTRAPALCVPVHSAASARGAESAGSSLSSMPLARLTWGQAQPSQGSPTGLGALLQGLASLPLR